MTTPRGDAGQTGRMPGPGPTGPPVEVWRALGLITSFYSFYGPVAAGDLVYAFAPGPPRVLRAFSAATGDEIWRMALAGLLFLPTAPTIAGGLAYAVGREAEEPQRPILMAFETRTGEERWRVQIGSRSLHQGHSRVAADGVVYVASTNGVIYAFDAATGQELWTAPAVVGGAPSLGDGLLVILHMDGVLALDAATGQERWRAWLEPWGNIAIAGGLVYAMSKGANGSEGVTLYALDATSGSERWAFDGAAGLAGDPAIGDGAVYAGRSGGLVALDPVTGEVRWQRPDLVNAQTPAPVGDVVYVTDEARLIALNGATGDGHWTVTDWNAASGWKRANAGGPVVAGGQVFLLATDVGTWSPSAMRRPPQWPKDARDGSSAVSANRGQPLCRPLSPGTDRLSRFLETQLIELRKEYVNPCLNRAPETRNSLRC